MIPTAAIDGSVNHFRRMLVLARFSHDRILIINLENIRELQSLLASVLY